VRLHGRPDGPTDFSATLRNPDAPVHAIAMGLAHGAQSHGQRTGRSPPHRIRHLRPQSGLPHIERRPEAALRLAARESAPPSPGPHWLRHRQAGRRPLHPADARPGERPAAQRVRMARAEDHLETCCHPTEDMIAVTVRGRIPVVFEFPYASGAMDAADWAHPEKHQTSQQAATPNRLDLDRRLDGDPYTVSIAWPGVAAEIKRESAHRFVLTPASDRLDLCCGFQRAGHSAAGPAATFAAAEK